MIHLSSQSIDDFAQLIYMWTKLMYHIEHNSVNRSKECKGLDITNININISKTNGARQALRAIDRPKLRQKPSNSRSILHKGPELTLTKPRPCSVRLGSVSADSC